MHVLEVGIRHWDCEVRGRSWRRSLVERRHDLGEHLLELRMCLLVGLGALEVRLEGRQARELGVLDAREAQVLQPGHEHNVGGRQRGTDQMVLGLLEEVSARVRACACSLACGFDQIPACRID